MELHEYGSNKPYNIRAISVFKLEQVEFSNGELHTKIWDDPRDEGTLLKESVSQIMAQAAIEEYRRGYSDCANHTKDVIEYYCKGFKADDAIAAATPDLIKIIEGFFK